MTKELSSKAISLTKRCDLIANILRLSKIVSLKASFFSLFKFYILEVSRFTS